MCFLEFGFWLGMNFSRIFGLAVVFLGMGVSHAAAWWVYVGTFSAKAGTKGAEERHGRGIHVFEMNGETGLMRAVGVCEDAGSPSELVLNKAGTLLYAVMDGEVDGAGKKQSLVKVYRVNRETGGLAFWQEMAVDGEGATQISFNEKESVLWVASYDSGSVGAIGLKDGGLDKWLGTHRDVGTVGAAKASSAPSGSFAVSGHDAAHAHMIQSDPSGRWVLWSDLGLDRLYVGKFERNEKFAVVSEGVLPSGDGPRHFVFHPKARYVYSLQEEASTLATWSFDGEQGRLRLEGVQSALPRGYEGTSFASAIHLSPDGRYLYAANRLSDSISIFSLEKAGSPKWVGSEATRGSYPRQFQISPDGKWLVCCNQKADHVAIFAVDQASGMLKFTGQYAAVGSPAAAVFVPKTP